MGLYTSTEIPALVTPGFLSRSFFFVCFVLFFPVAPWLKHICAFVLGQWLWRELIIGKVRPIHKCIGCRERGTSPRRISGYLEDLALGREKGRPHRRFTGADCLSQPGQPIPCLSLLIMHTSQTAPEIFHRGNGWRSRVLYIVVSK